MNQTKTIEQNNLEVQINNHLERKEYYQVIAFLKENSKLYEFEASIVDDIPPQRYK